MSEFWTPRPHDPRPAFYLFLSMIALVSACLALGRHIGAL